MTRGGFFSSQVHFVDELSEVLQNSKCALLIFDEKLLQLSPLVAKWIEAFTMKYPVLAGESLKELQLFPSHMEKILSLVKNVSRQELQVVALGGGTVGDFSGFVASVLKRGVPLVQIPSTWLAAIDSAHGGKTGLNSRYAKNQVGTFYPARDIYIVKSLLQSQPAQLWVDGLSEMVKMAFISGGKWSHDLCESLLRGEQLVNGFLPSAIRAKWQVVEKDPFEETGARRVLNLGHTFGHVVELHYKISHGQAVGLGLHFALGWSKKRGILSGENLKSSMDLIQKHLPLDKLLKEDISGTMTRETFWEIATQDKKTTAGGKIYFLFVKSIGEVVEEAVSVEEFYLEARQQGWVL